MSGLVIGCKTPEHVLAALSTWPDPDFPWCITDLTPGVTEDQLRAEIAYSGMKWAKICGLQPREVTDGNKARLLVTCRAIDGPGGVLAETELPAGQKYVRMWLDVGEQWNTLTPAIRAISLGTVIRHEMGHAIGIGHAPDGSNNWMAPYLNESLVNAGPFDISESTKRYSLPSPTVPTNPTIPTVPTTPIPGGSPMGFLATLLKFFSTIDPTTLSNIINLIKTFTTAFGQLPKAQQQQLLEALHAETGDAIQALKAAP